MIPILVALMLTISILPPQPTQTEPSGGGAGPVSWQDLQVFLAQDHTNWNEWSCPAYTCVEFSNELVRNALDKGIVAGITTVMWKDSSTGHALVWFDTTDKGRVYIEPQDDYEYALGADTIKLCQTRDAAACWPGSLDGAWAWPLGEQIRQTTNEEDCAK